MFLERLTYWSEKAGGKSFLIVDEEHYSYKKIYEEVQLKAAEWQVAEGHIVLIKAESFIEQVISWFALLAVKAYPVVIHYDLPRERFESLLEKSGASFVVLPEKGLCPYPDKGKWANHLILEKPSLPEKVAFGVCSSGSTGVPKLLWRSSASWYDFFEEQNKVFSIDHRSKLFLHGSFSFTGNMNSFLSVFYEGGTIVTSAYFSPKKWYDLCVKEEATTLYVLPTKLRLLAKYIEKGLPSLKTLFTGSQMPDLTLWEFYHRILPKAQIILYYGATELNYITYCTYEEWRAEPGIVGKPFKGVEVSVKEGLVYIDTPYAIEGSGIGKAFRPIMMPYTVEDRGYFTDTGMLAFKGRAGEVINHGGFKLSILSLEESMRAIEGIEDVAVLAVPDELRGEVPFAFVKLSASLQEVKGRMKECLMPVEQPKQLIEVPYIPLTSCSKVDKEKLRALIEEN